MGPERAYLISSSAYALLYFGVFFFGRVVMMASHMSYHFKRDIVRERSRGGLVWQLDVSWFAYLFRAYASCSLLWSGVRHLGGWWCDFVVGARGHQSRLFIIFFQARRTNWDSAP